MTEEIATAPVAIRSLRHAGWQLRAVTMAGGLEMLAPACRTREARPIAQLAFGGLPVEGHPMPATDWPLTWIQGEAQPHLPASGSQGFALAGAPYHPLSLAGRAVGGWFEDAETRYCLLGNLLPARHDAAPEVQAREVFEQMEAALALAGFAITDLVRTWFYLSRMLEWYAEFNAVRNRFFTERGIFEHLVPASTGIGARNAAGTALVAGALAIRSQAGRPRIYAVPSPLQCPALDYRSAFSRAVEVVWRDARLLLISGTASIAPDGHSAHRGDIHGQIALTMEVVAAILAAREMGWEHATRAVVYLKSLADAPAFADYCRVNGIPRLPAVLAETDICRPELLFEIEIDAGEWQHRCPR